MKSIVGFALFFLFLVIGSPLFSQNYEGGIRQVDIGNNLPTYDIKLVTLPSATLGNRLENAFLQKESFVQADSDWEEKTIRIIALHPVKKEELNDVVEFAGFEVAKSFEE